MYTPFPFARTGFFSAARLYTHHPFDALAKGRNIYLGNDIIMYIVVGVIASVLYNNKIIIYNGFRPSRPVRTRFRNVANFSSLCENIVYNSNNNNI